ncbi:MAG: hypothetical protein ACYC9U_15815 [Nitrososphaerales archaeon]
MKAKIALGLTLVVALLSVFIATIGLPASEESVSIQCSGCVQTVQFSTFLVPTLLALIPLLIAIIIGAGLLIKHWMILSWIGIIVLLGFSFISIFSMGVFYMPLAIGLVVALAAVQTDRTKILR